MRIYSHLVEADDDTDESIGHFAIAIRRHIGMSTALLCEDRVQYIILNVRTNAVAAAAAAT